jgi:hypothetical protein
VILPQSQTAAIGFPALQLVDADGYRVACTERCDFDPPSDPWADPIWDFIRLEAGPAADPEPTAAERAELESWLASLDGDYPPVDQADDDDFPASLPVDEAPDRLNVESFRNIADIVGRCR